jgi:hypothetical protein
MKRLFTFGCSYTNYGWPTWADLLGLEFDHFENWGLAGTGCRSIQERIIECHVRNEFKPGDTVIVQWSSHLRNDFHNTNNALPGRIKGWRTDGSLFNHSNHKLYSDRWLDIFFNEQSFIMHCLNSIAVTQQFLDNLGVTWYMSSIGEWDKLGSDLDVISAKNETIRNVENLWDTFPDLSIYKDKIWDSKVDHWLTPHAIDASKYPDLYWWFKAKHDKEIWREQHPSMSQHSLWLTDIRCKLKLPEKLPEAHVLWVDQVEDIKSKSMDMLQFTSFLIKDNSTIAHWPKNIWPKSYIGF